MKIAIIGAGVMGSWFARFAKRNRWSVSITDIKIGRAKQVAKSAGVKAVRSNKDAVADADVVVVAVPIAATASVARAAAKHMRTDSLLIDLASAKVDVVKKMQKLKVKPELASLHPLFGPGARSVKGRTIVSIPIKQGKVYREFTRRLRSLGAKVVEMKAEDHDRLMAITQCMTHFVLMTYISALKSMKNAKRAEKLQTPMSGELYELAKAFLATSPDLHGEIQAKNRYASIARRAVLDSCRSLNRALKTKDAKALRRMYGDACRLIGPAKTRAAYKKLYEEVEKA